MDAQNGALVLVGVTRGAKGKGSRASRGSRVSGSLGRFLDHHRAVGRVADGASNLHCELGIALEATEGEGVVPFVVGAMIAIPACTQRVALGGGFAFPGRPRDEKNGRDTGSMEWPVIGVG